jgi:hypothetical protein
MNVVNTETVIFTKPGFGRYVTKLIRYEIR